MSRSNEFVEVSHYLPFSFLSSSNCKSSKNLSSRYSYEFSTLIFCSNISNRKHICFTQKLLLISISPPFLPLKWTFSYMFFIYVFYLPILLAFFLKHWPFSYHYIQFVEYCWWWYNVVPIDISAISSSTALKLGSWCRMSVLLQYTFKLFFYD